MVILSIILYYIIYIFLITLILRPFTPQRRALSCLAALVPPLTSPISPAFRRPLKRLGRIQSREHSEGSMWSCELSKSVDVAWSWSELGSRLSRDSFHGSALLIVVKIVSEALP